MVPTTPAQDTPVVLVAEDEALVRMMTVDVLEEAGCAVIEAASAEAALSVLDERSDHVCGLVSGPSGRARERRIPRPGNENPSQVNRANLRSKPPSPLRFERFRSTRLGRSRVVDRYRTVPGSAFEVDWGSGYDLVLLTNFLHHFDQETCVGLLERARRSLGEGGRVLAVEFVPNEDRVSPPFPAMFAVMMLGSTPSGDAYAAREFEEMGRAAGFARIRVDPLPPSPQSLVTFEQA
jgi:CheY-like chemotaxis protein